MEEITPVKKTARTRKAVVAQDVSVPDAQSSTPVSSNSQGLSDSIFDDVIGKISKSRQEFDNLQKEIAQIKLDWSREQKQHELEITQQKTQQEIERKREKETYEYETSLMRKRAEDEFADKKLSWEKDLLQRKQELEDQKKELEDLRKQVSGFEDEKEKDVKNATELLEKQLTDKFNQEKTLREQEIKSDKEMLGLKIANLETDNVRLNKEIEIIKRSLDEATRQVKEIAVKVIESGSNQTKPQVSPDS